jgi:hypothetical protein
MVPSPPEVIQRFGSSKWQKLRRPHLVLADLGGDEGVACPWSARRRCSAYCGLMIWSPVGCFYRRGSELAAPCVDLLPPFFQRGSSGLRLSLPHLRACFQHLARNRRRSADIDAHVLVDRAWVDVDVDLALRVRREGVERPVTRSSKRAPMQIITSQSCIASWLRRCRACRACPATAGHPRPDRRRGPSGSR